ncbi:MAG TPA: 30S ribosome-binding factor RbfA [Ruminococcaceae bacterium]|nr:30S ribosome-binding factor RbfA [Oscillospiraceae bacterium]
MPNFRISRLSEDLKRELTDIFRSLKDPRITGLISIVKLELSNDLSHCKVYISSMQGLEAAKSAVEGLNNAAGYIRREVNLRLEMRRSPDFKFVADNSIEYSADISQKLKQLNKTEE